MDSTLLDSNMTGLAQNRRDGNIGKAATARRPEPDETARWTVCIPEGNTLTASALSSEHGAARFDKRTLGAQVTHMSGLCHVGRHEGRVAYRGANDVHPMAASIVQLLQLHEALHLLPAAPTDDGGGEQHGDVFDSLPHLHCDASGTLPDEGGSSSVQPVHCREHLLLC